MRPANRFSVEEADPSMDVYALGATLYTMLTRTPVHSNTLIEAMNNLSKILAQTRPERSRVCMGLVQPDLSKIDPKFQQSLLS